jgi:hypothetical protein
MSNILPRKMAISLEAIISHGKRYFDMTDQLGIPHAISNPLIAGSLQNIMNESTQVDFDCVDAI